jgi:hypothetical protein
VKEFQVIASRAKRRKADLVGTVPHTTILVYHITVKLFQFLGGHRTLYKKNGKLNFDELVHCSKRHKHALGI